MKRIIIDNSHFQTRIALCEDGEPIEFFYESNREKSLVGNIYAGRVENIIKGMQSCFVNIGQEKNGYLPIEKGTGLKNGDTVIVQVKKDAFGTKGPALTRKISFIGKFAVLIPNDKDIGISKKITDSNERERINSIVKDLVPEGCALIVRTEGEGKSLEEFKDEIESLIEKKHFVEKKAGYRRPPALILSDENIIDKTLKNIFTSDIDSVVLNNKDDYDRVAENRLFDSSKLELYTGDIPIFSNYLIESKIDRLFLNKVWLKSGGFIVIEQTEACVVIDVNTGKYTGKKNTQDTFLKTNLEAADEIAKQIRLRNLSGMIIIDFIDMKDEKDKEALTKRLEEAVKKDRLKTTVVGMTELGLMQLTRKKGSLPVLSLISEECVCCRGRGAVPSAEYTAGKILREITAVFSSTMFSQVTVKSNKRIISFLRRKEWNYVEDIEKRFKKTVVLEEIETGAADYYELERKTV